MKKLYENKTNESSPTWRKLLTFMLISVFMLVTAMTAMAQTEVVTTIPAWDGTQTIEICVDGTVTVQIANSESGHTYRIRKTQPLPAVTIQDLVGTGGTITFDPISIFTTTGSYTIAVRDVTDENPDFTFTVNVTADLTAPILTPTPATGLICPGTSVSATLSSAGFGGVTGSNDYFEYRINGSAWQTYTLGDAIPDNNENLSVDIRAFREHPDGLGCFAENIYSWTYDTKVQNFNTGKFYCTLQEAITTADIDDVLKINGELVLTSSVSLNKRLTIDGQNLGTLKGDNSIVGSYFILITGAGAGSTIKNLSFVKTDKAGPQNIIGLQANDVTFDNCTFTGQYVLGDPEVSRAFETAYNITEFLIQNCNISALRQPGYFNPGSQGQVLNNYVEGTRGWTVFGQTTPLTLVVFNGNSWLNNAVDIFLDPSVHFGAPYDPISTLSANNNNANFQDDRTNLKVVNVTKSKVFITIQAAINDAAAGDVIEVAEGIFTGHVSVNRSLTLKGVRYGVDANERTGAETLIHGTFKVEGAATDVTIDGFSFLANSGANELGIGGPYHSGIFGTIDNLTIANNIFNKAAYTNGSFTNPGLVFVTAGDLTMTQNVFDQYVGLAQDPNAAYFTISAGGTANIANNTFTGALAVGANANTTVSVQDNKVNDATKEGIWFWPVNETAQLTITGNEIVEFDADETGAKALKITDRPASVNGKTITSEIAESLLEENTIESVKFDWVKPVHNITQDTYFDAIQAAINAANPDDVITVVAGTYTEQITLNKVITLKGANAGIAAGANPGTREQESVVHGGFYVTAAATIDGFQIKYGSSSGSILNCVTVATSGITVINSIMQDVSGNQNNGIETLSGVNNFTLTNSTITNNWRGIYLNPGSGHILSGNLVIANNGVGVGIGSDGQSNLTLSGNIISNHTLEGWGASAVGAEVNAEGNQFLNNGVSIAHYGGQIIDANNNWFGSDTYADIFPLVQGAVDFVPYYLDAQGTESGGGPTEIANLVVTYTHNNKDIFVSFDVTVGDMELLPVPGLSPTDPNYEAQVIAAYTALGDAIELNDPDAIQAAALAIGDDVIIDYYYFIGGDKYNLKTINNNPLVKSKYWNNYLVREDNVRFPNWVPGEMRTSILQDNNYRTHTNPGTNSVAGDWLEPALGHDVYVTVTLIQNGVLSSDTKMVSIPAGPVNLYSADPSVPGNLVSSHYTIQSAINAADNGYYIVLNEGVFAEDASSASFALGTKQGIKFIGATDTEGNPLSIIQGSLYLNDNDGGKVENIEFVYNTTTSLLTLLNTNGLEIRNCVFVGDDFETTDIVGINHVSGPNGNSAILVEDCKFIDGLHVSINSRFGSSPGFGHLFGLHVKNSLFDNVKSGINQQSANDVIVENSTFNLSGNSSYGVRFASATDIANNLTISESVFTVAPGHTSSYAIHLRAAAGGTIVAQYNSIGFEVWNESTALFNATCNWWGTEDADEVTTLVTGNVQYLPFLRVDNDYGDVEPWWSTDKYSCIGVGPVIVYDQDPSLPGTEIISSHMTIQAAIDATTTQNGHFIAVSSGNYDELVNVSKGVTLSGFGADNTLLENSSPADAKFLTISASDVAIKDIAIVGPEGSSTSTGIFIDGEHSNISLVNVISNQHNYGVHVDASADITNLSLTNTELNVNGNALQIDAGAKVDGLTITGGEMSGNLFGLSVAANNTADNSNDLKNVTITGTEFKDNAVFGLLFNKGQNMTLDGITVTGNGNASTFGLGAGIYFTWREGTYDGITLTNSTITGNRSSGTDNGGGIWVRPRANAIVTGIEITNNFISGNGSADNAATAGILVLKNNDNAGTDPGILINNNSITGNANFGIASTTDADIDATCNWFGLTDEANIAAITSGNVDYTPWLVPDVNGAIEPWWSSDKFSCSGTPVKMLTAVPTAEICEVSGSILVTWEGGSADYIVSWSGTGTGSEADIEGTSYNVSGLDAGTYDITVTDANGSWDVITGIVVNYLPVTLKDNLLVVKDYYATIQAAINAAASGDVIELCEGNYVENLDFLGLDGRTLTIKGAQAGVSAGPGATRNNTSTTGESIIQGNYILTNNNTVGNLYFDGLRWETNAAGPVRLNGELVIENTIFFNNYSGTSTGSMYIFSFSGIASGIGHDVTIKNSNLNSQRGILNDNFKTKSLLVENNVINVVFQGFQVSANATSGGLTVKDNVINAFDGATLVQGGQTFLNNTFNTSGRGIRLGTGTSGTIETTTITGNVFNSDIGILLGIPGGTPLEYGPFVANGNDFSNVSTKPIDLAGAFDGVNGPFNATCNWWGTQPEAYEYPAIQAMVVGPVVFEPWLIEVEIEDEVFEWVCEGKRSTYEFAYDPQGLILIEEDVDYPVTFQTDVVGSEGYEAVRFGFNAAGPDGSTVTFKATDSQGVTHTFTNEGVWGPGSGFALPADYTATTDWTLNFSAIGTYTITFFCHELGEEENPFVTGSQEIIVDVRSTYAFDYEIPALILEGEESPMDVTFETDFLGTVGYDAVRFAFSVSDKPEGSTVTFVAEDSNGVIHTFTNIGVWGPAAGFELPADYSATTEWTITYSHPGDYEITFSCHIIENGNLGDIIASGTQEVLAREIPTILFVDDDWDGSAFMADLGDGKFFGYNSYATITDAIDAANDGNTIEVAAGNYNEQIVVIKSLDIRGAQYGVDARNRTQNQSVITGVSGNVNNPLISIQADNSTLNGFKIIGGGWYLIETKADNIAILNNILEGTLFTEDTPISEVAISQNWFRNSDHNAIYFQRNASDITITNNLFTDIGYSAMILAGATADYSGISFQDNEINGTGNQAINIFGKSQTDLVISDNIISNAGWNSSDRPAIRLYSGLPYDGLTIQNNVLSNSKAGLAVTPGTVNWTNAVISGNTFNMNVVQVRVESDNVDLESILANNTFDRAVVVRDNPIVVPIIFSKIQDGINAAADGQIVDVAAGTYSERLNVNKAVEIRGAQHGVDPTVLGAREVIAQESVIDATALSVPNPDVVVEIPVGISGATISGFTIIGTTGPGYADKSVTRCWGSNISIKDNIIDGYVGVILKNNNDISIERNRITANKNGIVANQGTFDKLLISGNSILPGMSIVSDPGGIQVSNSTNSTISNNTVTGWNYFGGGRSLGGSNHYNLSITGNTLSGSNDGISIFGNSTSIIIEENTITNNLRYGINIKGANLTIENNIITGNENAGVFIDKNVIETENVIVKHNFISANTNNNIEVTSTVIGPVNATCNWFGPEVLSEIAEMISGDVNWAPYLVEDEDGNVNPWWSDDKYSCSGVAPVRNITRNVPYAVIQRAVNEALVNETIEVSTGIYYENIVIDVTGLSLTNADESDPVIDGGGTGTVVTITADDVTFEGFTVKNSGSTPTEAGIYLNQVTGCEVSNNFVVYNASGIAIVDGSDNTIAGNQIYSNAFYGIALAGSSGNTIELNTLGHIDGETILANGLDAIALDNLKAVTGESSHITDGSNENSIKTNTILKSLRDGIFIGENCYDNEFTDGNIISNVASIGIHVWRGGAQTITDNSITSSDVGVKLRGTIGATLTGNTITGNDIGVEVEAYYLGGTWYQASGNTISNNTIANNTSFGLKADHVQQTIAVDAANNWWGHITGPFHATNTCGEGNAVSDNVLFTPWFKDANMLETIPLVPLVSGPASVSGGQSYVYSTVQYPGHSYEWIVTNGTAVVNPAPNDWQAEITWSMDEEEGTVVVRVYTDPLLGGCYRESEVYEVAIDPVALRGLIAYRNNARTPMNNVIVKLLAADATVKAVTTTSPTGYYEFATMPEGVTQVEVSTAKNWGGANSTDALAIQRRSVGLFPPFYNPINPDFTFRDNVGDVRNTNIVNASDALFVRHRAIQLITSFPAGDWAFWAVDDDIVFSNTAANTAVMELGTSSILNIDALCYGDVNGSFVPGGAKSLMAVHNSNVTHVTKEMEFELPLFAETDMEFSALTVFLQYDQSRLDIRDVKSVVPGLEFAIVDGWINVAWSDLDPVSIQAGDALFTLVLATTYQVNENDLLFNLGSATEFADKNGKVINDYKLSINRVDNNNEFTMTCYPNPFNSILNVSYSLAESANVRVTLVNSMGMEVAELANRHHDSGTYRFVLNPDEYSLGKGLYFVNMQVEDGSRIFTRMVKVVYVN